MSVRIFMYGMQVTSHKYASYDWHLCSQHHTNMHRMIGIYAVNITQICIVWLASMQSHTNMYVRMYGMWYTQICIICIGIYTVAHKYVWSHVHLWHLICTNMCDKSGILTCTRYTSTYPWYVMSHTHTHMWVCVIFCIVINTWYIHTYVHAIRLIFCVGVVQRHAHPHVTYILTYVHTYTCRYASFPA